MHTADTHGQCRTWPVREVKSSRSPKTLRGSKWIKPCSVARVPRGVVPTHRRPCTSSSPPLETRLSLHRYALKSRTYLRGRTRKIARRGFGSAGESAKWASDARGRSALDCSARTELAHAQSSSSSGRWGWTATAHPRVPFAPGQKQQRSVPRLMHRSPVAP
jgi:hypothetical protein